MKTNKGQYALIFVLVLLAGFLFRIMEDSTFVIVKNQTAYAPELDVVNAENIAENATEDTGPINIYVADVNELSELPGIGEAMAKRIITYRTKYGKFEVIQDIMKVSGIGTKIFESIKLQICVQ